MERSFVWALILALGGGASIAASPLRAQPDVILGENRRRADDRVCDDVRRRDDVNCDDRRRDGDPVYRDGDWNRDNELRKPGRNGRGHLNGRGNKNGLRKNPGRGSGAGDWGRDSDVYRGGRESDVYPGGRDSEVYGGYRTLTVDRQYYPQNGECRVWFANRPTRYQLPSMECDRLNGRVPAGSFILYDYRAWDADFDWARYAQQSRERIPSVIVQLSQSMRR